MKDPLAAGAAALGDNEAIRSILNRVCRITQMGFAAVARVTEERWIACQVIDKIEFGLKPGDELDIKTTICNDIRRSGRRIVIDHVGGHADWRTHPVPMLYGFESYVSLPIVIDETFFGTLCAIDSEPRALSAPDTIATLEICARQVAEILAGAAGPDGAG